MSLRIVLRIAVLLLIGLAVNPVGGQTAPATGFPLTPGKAVEGNINNTAFSWRYSFDAQAGDSLTIRMDATSGNLDPFLILFSPAGDLLLENDDASTGDRNAQIDLAASQSGTYVVEATRFQGESGPSSGTYRLQLVIAGAVLGGANDPLSRAPSFGVPFKYIDYQDLRAGILASSSARQYFAVGGEQGDLVRVTMTRTAGDLVPKVTMYNEDFIPVSRESQAALSETIAYTTLPKTGWYLIEAEPRVGSGSFALYVDRLTVAVLQIGQTVSGEFTVENDTVSYIVNARIGDQLLASVFTSSENSGLLPELSLLNLSQETLATSRATTDPTARVRAVIPPIVIPRSEPYILQVTNLRPEVVGTFELRLSGIPVNVAKLSEEIAIPASYNNLYKGIIDDNNRVAYYHFAGKTNELVTVEMTATDGSLDPFVVLADGQLNELAFNDNVGNTRNARLVQFALPQDGDYFILASRAGLASGTTSGSYKLALTVGQIALAPGPLAVTVTWKSDVDLNLFVRDPSGRAVSWSYPTIPSGGALQIDSNTRCETPTAQPVEHIYWPPGVEPPPGEYQIWVWYQNVCTQRVPATFALQLTAEGQTVLDVKPGTFTLRPDERFEATFFVTASGVFVTEPGAITSTTAQQRASQGGDALILYGQRVTGTISDDVFALFYQFSGAAGDRVAISLDAVTGDLDPFVVLRDASDNNLASNDDADDTTRSSRLDYTLPANGQYVIAVTRYGLRDGTTTGDFRLTLRKQ